MAPKKVTRKQLLKEPDEFLTFSSKLLRVVLENKPKVMALLGIVLAATILYSALRYFSERSESQASELLAQKSAAYNKVLQEEGPQAAYQKVAEDFQRLLEDYGSKSAGHRAAVLFAHICLKAGEYDQAIEQYTQALAAFEQDPALKSLILSGLAYGHEGKQEWPKAIAALEQVIAMPEALVKDQAYFNLGRLYAQMGENQKSRSAYQQIISDYPNSIYVQIARELVAG